MVSTGVVSGETELIESKPEPRVLQTSLDDFYVSYELNAVTRQPNEMPVIYSDLHRNILDQCHQAGIEITSPHHRSNRESQGPSTP